MTNEKQQDEAAKNLDDRIQEVLRNIAGNLYAFHNGQRTGCFHFEVSMEAGEVPEKGFVIHLDEVL